ncbi:MAG: Txe/YoeB family addiction module toxin [Bacteroidales bacterium]|nr:Txe/YoeB family addiction module toxin [Bacteroidales bacterium]
MEIIYKEDAIDDMLFWKKSGNVSVQKKITELIADISAHPKTGIGKPEELKHELSGLWSRHIDRKNRIVYQIFETEVHILSWL